MTSSNDILDRAKAALAGVTPGPWTHHTAPNPGSGETPEQYCINTLRGDGEQLHVVTASSPDPSLAYVVPALTGDGPTSAINAEFIAQARELMPELIAEVERVRSACQLIGSHLDSTLMDVARATDSLDLLDESRDGDWMLIFERLAELRPQRDEARAEVEQLKVALEQRVSAIERHLLVQAVQASLVESINSIGAVLIGSAFVPITASPVPDTDIAEMLASAEDEVRKANAAGNSSHQQT